MTLLKVSIGLHGSMVVVVVVFVVVCFLFVCLFVDQHSTGWCVVVRIKRPNIYQNEYSFQVKHPSDDVIESYPSHIFDNILNAMKCQQHAPLIKSAVMTTTDYHSLTPYRIIEPGLDTRATLHHSTLVGSVKVGIVKQEVGGQLFVLVAQHVRPEDRLTIEPEGFQLTDVKAPGSECQRTPSSPNLSFLRSRPPLWTHPSYGLGLLLCQLDDRLSRCASLSEISFLEIALLVIACQQLVEGLGVLVDQLGKLRVVGRDLLDEGLDHRRVL